MTSVSKKSEITKDSKVDILTKKDTSIKVATLKPKQTKPISTRARLKTKPDLTIYFDEAKSEINNFELSKLEKIIQKNPSKNIYLKAHNDSLGTKASNKKLSEERIASIKNVLESKGLKAAIEAEIDGGKNSLESNKTAIGRANNRRIEIFIED